VVGHAPAYAEIVTRTGLPLLHAVQRVQEWTGHPLDCPGHWPTVEDIQALEDPAGAEATGETP
jgi:hypothetical protein